MTKLFRDAFIAGLLVLLWHYLHPFTFEVVAAMPIKDGRVYGVLPMWMITIPVLQYTLLFSFTAWMFRFVRFGWSEEVEIFQLQGMTVMASFLRWVLLAIVILLLAPALAVLMLHLLEQYTTIPRWLVLTTVWLVVLMFLYLGWLFPETQVNRLRSRYR